MPFEQFLDLTPKEFWAGLTEKEKHEKEVTTYQVRMICETLRTQTVYLMNIHGAKVRYPKKIMKFPWETTHAKPAQTAEELKKQMKAIAEAWGSKQKENG